MLSLLPGGLGPGAGVNSIESQQTIQQSFYSSVGHPVVLKTLLKILLKSLLKFNLIDFQDLGQSAPFPVLGL